MPAEIANQPTTNQMVMQTPEQLAERTSSEQPRPIEEMVAEPVELRGGDAAEDICCGLCAYECCKCCC